MSTKKNESGASGRQAPLFRKTNIILMIVGVVVLIIGYICLRGGAVSDPNTFDGEIFNTRRIVVAPILMVLGIIVVGVGIMWHPRRDKSPVQKDEITRN